MNAVEDVRTAAKEATSWAKFKELLDTEHLREFGEFCEFRKECAAAASEVMNNY